MTDPGFSRSQNRPVPRPSIAANGKAKPSWRDFAISAPDLCDEQFPSVRFLIPGLIPEGVMLLVGRPKLGKSWLLLQIASSVAQGAITLISDPNTPQACGDVLHLSLEDGKRRLQRRMTKYFGAIRRNWPVRMTIVPQWRRLDQGGIDDIREWCKSVPNPTLVTIDTLKKVRPTTKGTETSYATDYEANEKLIQLCHEFPGLAIIVAHHDRKMDADDPFDTISGTLGCLTPAHERENSHGAALAWPWAASGPVSLRRHRWHKPRVSSSVTTYLCSNISALARRLGLDVTAWEVHGKRAGAFRAAVRPLARRIRIDRGHPMALLSRTRS
jgi:hypothetical protein